MSQLDRTAPYRGPADRLALVKGIVAADAPTIETDWLEIKREADLTKKAWQGELATHVLGFFNRPPERASRVVGGYAYVVVGAEPGAVRGVEAVDPAILEESIGRFIRRGEHAPAWEPFYVVIDGRSVLLIVVDPPSAGIAPAPLRATFEARNKRTVPEGRLFVRRNGQTVEASAAEVDQLFARTVAAGRRLDIDVVSESPIRVTPLDLSDDAIDRWLAIERARLLGDGRPDAIVANSPLASLLGIESRSRQEFIKEVNDYLDEVRPVVREHAAYRAVEAGVGTFQLSVVNQTEDNFANVAVELYVPGAVSAYFEPDEAEPKDGLPVPPWPWGKQRPLGYPSFDLAPVMPRPHVPRPGHIDNSGSARIAFEEVNVRPGYTHFLAPVTLIADVSLAGQVVEGAWYATSTSVSGITDGTVSISVASEATDVAALMASEAANDE